MYPSVIKKEGSSIVAMGAGLRSAASLADDYVSPPKYKSSLLHRYLNDSLRHVMVANAVVDARKRNHSGSFSSNEYDDELLSPSSSEADGNFVYRTGKRERTHASYVVCSLRWSSSPNAFTLSTPLPAAAALCRFYRKILFDTMFVTMLVWKNST